MQIVVCLLLATIAFPFTRLYAVGSDRSAEALIERIVGKEKSHLFEVEYLSSVKGKDVFEIETRKSKVVLRGNRPVAVASALNWYLKYYCKQQYS